MKRATALSADDGKQSSIFTKNRQITAIGFLPDWVANPRLAEPYIRNTAEMGFAALYIFVFWVVHRVNSPRIHDAVKAMVAFGQQCSLKMLLEIGPDRWTGSFVEEHPDAAYWAIGSVEATVYSGHFEMRIAMPDMVGLRRFQELSAIFVPAGEDYRYINAADCRYAVHTAYAHDWLVIQGQLNESYSGRAIFYIAIKGYGMADHAHPAFLQAQEDLLDFYADIPLDGFGWDEPGQGLSDMRFFKTGAGFIDLFERTKGYAFRPHLIYLDHLDGTSKAVQVRCDYYRMLNEMHYTAQKRHNDYAQSKANKKLIFGVHQTWCGYPADLVGGCLDYFRHGKVLTAAWTDGGCMNEPKYPIHNFMLAEGLKKELQLRDAYYNDWTMRYPGIGDMQFADHTKLLFHVNDYVHGIHDTLEHDRAATIQSRKDFDRFDELVTDRFAPHTDVAYVYSWDALAASPKWMARAFYTNIANSSLHLVDAGLYAAIMSGESIHRATIGDRCFTVNGFTYRVLVAPYINVVAEDVYRKIMAIAEAGVPVIVIGPPPEFTAEGKPIADDFARRCGFEPFILQQYNAAIAEQTQLPAVNEWEPSWMDATYPVTTTTGQKVMDQELKLCYVKAAARPLYYMPLPDPREELTSLVASLVTPLVETYAEGTYYRFFPHREDQDHLVVVAVAKAHVTSFGLTPDKHGSGLRPPIRSHSLKALFRLQGSELIVEGGAWCAVRLERGKVAEIIGNCPHIRWNGRGVNSREAVK